MTDYKYKFTVFTPTFNRRHTLHRVYDSLCHQTYRSFEWLIVDDGSTDGTAELVQKWQSEAKFPIRYQYFPNSGKHVSFNRAVSLADGELFLPLDSDDACVPTALERLLFHWESIPDKERWSFSAVTALVEDQYGNIVGDRFPYDVTDSDSNEMRYRFKVDGEKWGFHRTEILKQYPFPELPRANHVPEGIVWQAISNRYKTRYVNEPLRKYWVAPKRGPSDNLTARIIAPSPGNAAAYAHASKTELNNYMRYFWRNPAAFFREALLYSLWSFHEAGLNVRNQFAGLSNPARIIWTLCLPVGFLMYCRHRLRQESHPWRFVLIRILVRTGLCRLFIIKRKRYRLRFYPSALSVEYWKNDNERKDDETFLTDYLREGNCVIDVGANIGALAITAAIAVGRKGCVIAIEAHPRVYKYLVGNISLNNLSNVSAINLAVGETCGTARFSDARSDDQNAIVERSTLSVEMKTLDDIVGDSGQTIDLLKVDTEGYERFVLNGAHKLLARTECVFFESWDEHFKRFNYSSADLIKDLQRSGFTVVKSNGNRTVVQLQEGYRSAICENLLAIRDVKKFLARTAYEFASTDEPRKVRSTAAKSPG